VTRLGEAFGYRECLLARSNSPRFRRALRVRGRGEDEEEREKREDLPHGAASIFLRHSRRSGLVGQSRIAMSMSASASGLRRSA